MLFVCSKGYLNDHINGAHIKEELYKCKECPMTFTRKASFKYHFKRAHILKKRVLEPRGTFLKDCEYCGKVIFIYYFISFFIYFFSD